MNSNNQPEADLTVNLLYVVMMLIAAPFLLAYALFKCIVPAAHVVAAVGEVTREVSKEIARKEKLAKK